MPSFGDTHEPTTPISGETDLPDAFRETYAYWDGLRGATWASPWSSFRLEDLPPAILPWSVVVDIETDPPNFRYRFWGTERANLIGKELTGLRATDIPQADMRHGNIREYEEVCIRKEALLCQTPITTNTGRHAFCQSIRLPIRDDDENISHIYSAIDYTQISTAHYEIFGTTPDSRVPDPLVGEEFLWLHRETPLKRARFSD